MLERIRLPTNIEIISNYIINKIQGTNKDKFFYPRKTDLYFAKRLAPVNVLALLPSKMIIKLDQSSVSVFTH